MSDKDDKDKNNLNDGNLPNDKKEDSSEFPTFEEPNFEDLEAKLEEEKKEKEKSEEEIEEEKKEKTAATAQSKFRRLKVMILVFVIVGGAGLMWGITKFDLLNLKDGKAWEKIPFFKKEAKQEKKKDEQPKILPRVKVYKLVKQDFQDILHAIGTIYGITEIKLKFETNGVVKTFNFREGDILRRGEVIAELEHYDSELKVKFRKSKVKGAQAGLDAAKHKLATHQKLFDIGAIIKDKLEEVRLEVEKVKSDLEAAQIEVESAKSELEKTYLLSPLDGVLAEKHIEPGEFVTSSAKVAVIVEISAIYVEIGIIEKNLDKIEPGQKIRIKVDTYPDQEFFGEIENIAPMVGGNRTLTVKARIQNPENLLLPGMFARVKVTVYEKADTLVLPKAAVNSSEQEFHVFVIDKENKAKLTPVEVGHLTSDYTQIDAGIAVGDQVVIESLSPLKDGVEVEIVEVQETI